MSAVGLNQPKPRIVVWNSPRSGGPLRWSKDLTAQINSSGEYSARLVTHPLALLAGMVDPQADLVHAAVPATFKLWHKPYVLTVKGDYTIEKDFWKILYPRAIRAANVVTVPSQYLIDRIPELAQAVVIPNAVDLRQFTVSAEPNPDPFKMLIVSNFWFPEKARGIEELLTLIDRAASSPDGPAIQLTIVGDGIYLEKVKARARQFRFPITFSGWADPRTFFPATNLFLYYSFHDNMPNAVLEAMAAGLPVLTNNVGAIPEMIEDRLSGLVAETPDDYVDYLRQLLSDRALRQSLGRAARTRIEQYFSWETVIQEYLKMYRRLLV